MDHGCQELGNVPRRFQGDKQVCSSFNAFTTACQQSCQQAMVMMQQAKQKAKAGGSSADDVAKAVGKVEIS